jgi:hypothetical protein
LHRGPRDSIDEILEVQNEKEASHVATDDVDEVDEWTGTETSEDEEVRRSVISSSQLSTHPIYRVLASGPTPLMRKGLAVNVLSAASVVVPPNSVSISPGGFPISLGHPIMLRSYLEETT